MTNKYRNGMWKGTSKNQDAWEMSFWKRHEMVISGMGTDLDQISGNAKYSFDCHFPNGDPFNYTVIIDRKGKPVYRSSNVFVIHNFIDGLDYSAD